MLVKSAAVQAEYRRGMAQGDIYVSKSEIRHGSIDSMSKDDVLKALKELKNTYGNAIDITPDQDEDGSGALSAIEGSGAEIEDAEISSHADWKFCGSGITWLNDLWRKWFFSFCWIKIL